MTPAVVAGDWQEGITKYADVLLYLLNRPSVPRGSDMNGANNDTEPMALLREQD